jgi:hypothetical protein
MLIAIAAVLAIVFLGGHSAAVSPQLEQTEKLIKKDVTDEARRKQALDIVDQMKKTEKDSARESKKQTDSLADVLKDRQASADAIEAACQPLIANDAATADKLLDLRFELKSVLTRSEWGQVFPPPTTQPLD